MRFILNIIYKHKEKVKAGNNLCNNLIAQINTAIEELNALFLDSDSFIDPTTGNELYTKNEQLLTSLSITGIRNLKRTKNYKKLAKKRKELRFEVSILKQKIINHNTRVEEARLQAARNFKCNDLIARIDTALEELSVLFSDLNSFIDPQTENEWSSKNRSLISGDIIINSQDLKSADNYEKLTEKQAKLYQEATYLSHNITTHNDKVAEAKLPEAYALIGDVENKSLDKQQMKCIVKDIHNHLVIAGAGTGKTTTIVGKIKYLLKAEKCKPEDILVLSFTNASASEMSKRINKETGCNIDASTFHKLGLNIITHVNGITPKITKINLRSFIKEHLQTAMQSDEYLNLLSTYLLYNRVISKSEFEFKTKAEYEEYLRLNPPTTINNELVKSYGEMDIANFLTQNGIQYFYELPYKIDTRTADHAQYHPDFYLPEHDIYIEYFGVNENGEVPPYFKGSGKMTPSQTYRASMNWKRETHKANDTDMIECYAYEKLNGTLLENLKEKLIAKGVPLTPKSSKELWAQLTAEGNSIIDGVIELFETVINLIKTNGYTINAVRQLNDSNSIPQSKNAQKNNNTVLSLLEPIFDSYCSYLSEHEEIDFNDMINIATQYVTQEEYINPYKYVIIDEYQDISKSRFSLLNSLRKTGNYELFCVGDDWQSIYRFAGSDIGYIINFAQYWGPAEISKIETTYRFTQKLIEISSSFIMENPVQIKKQIKGQADTNSAVLGEINGYTDKFAIEFMAEKLEDLPINSSVFFIGRYNFDAKLLNSCGLFECHYNNISGVSEVKYIKRPDLNMRFITAHRSKGLQADYVFIINNKKSRMGFPSIIQDATILKLLLDNCDMYPHAEERRLFYVALTRAKKKVFLVTVSNHESVFVRELQGRYGDQFRKEHWECPLCGGRLLKRSGPYGDFFGCSNYRYKGCTYKKKIKNNSNSDLRERHIVF